MEKTIESMHSIYKMIGDETSKKIFEYRVMYSLTNDERYIHDLVKETMPMQWLQTELEKKNERDVLLYGAGMRGERILEHCSQFFCAVLDNAPDKKNEKIAGLKVLPVSEALRVFANPIIVLSQKSGTDVIIEDLCSRGIPKDNILNLGEKLTELYNGQYFDLEYFMMDEREVFVDCGAYDGVSSREFQKWCNNRYKHIYCFEPDNDNLKLCKNNLKEDIEAGKCTAINKGTWSNVTTLKFSKNADVSSHISDSDEENEEVEVTSLDKELLEKNHERVTFIKMDIEGSELESLKGAKRIISEQHPKLAISIYHKEEDIFEIPDYIRSLNPNYKFYLRHYTLKPWDTVLYAVNE